MAPKIINNNNKKEYQKGGKGLTAWYNSLEFKDLPFRTVYRYSAEVNVHFTLSNSFYMSMVLDMQCSDAIYLVLSCR